MKAWINGFRKHLHAIKRRKISDMNVKNILMEVTGLTESDLAMSSTSHNADLCDFSARIEFFVSQIKQAPEELGRLKIKDTIEAVFGCTERAVRPRMSVLK